MKLAATTALAGALAGALGLAPMQCKHDPDPANRLEDTAGDALWGLSEKFEKENDDAASKKTLRYLVDRYPSNRHAPAARAKLGEASGPTLAATTDGG